MLASESHRDRKSRSRLPRSPSRGSPPGVRPLLRLGCSSQGCDCRVLRANSTEARLPDARGVLAWSPLGQGRVAAPASTRELAVAAALDVHAAAYGVSRTAAAYSWIMAHPAGAIPIVGSQQVPRIREAADALKVRWTRAEWYEVLVASRQERLP